MKNSKLFLGITTLLLSAAGLFATKHFGPSIGRFYITINQSYCKRVNSICTNGGVNQCYYTVCSMFSCVRYPLFSKGPEGHFPAGSACTSPVKYQVEN